MNVEQLQQYCLSFNGATEKKFDEPSNIHSFSVQQKKFAYFKSSEPERWRFSFRVTPERFLELTDQPGIKPARYMHRYHWVTVVTVAVMDEKYLRELVAWSYTKALTSLSKKMQRELSA